MGSVGSDYLTIWKQRKISHRLKDEKSGDEQRLDQGEANNDNRLNDQSEDGGVLNDVGWGQWQW